MKRAVSGIKPTGQLNIGGYGGALHQFIKIQNHYECSFFVADLHALTVPQDPAELLQRSKEIAAFYIASGINYKTSTIFIQSHVFAHTELSWLLESQTYFGELGRMIQFKEKSEGKDTVSSALFTYPVLMAADILLYQSTHVPVGDDQKQHLELTRDIAQRFNKKYGNIFAIPEPIISSLGSRIMGLDDPEKKMSKSNLNNNSYILLLDSPADISKKISKAVTDTEKKVRYDWDNKPAVSNLIEIYAVFSGDSIEVIEHRYEGQGYGVFKKDLAEIIIDKLVPIQKNYYDIINSQELINILKEGATKAAEVADKTLKKVKEAMGLFLC